MNKRCTDPSCRRTFSTLNFDGKCPFCSKAYPQLRSGRKNELPTGKGKNDAVLLIDEGKRTVRVIIDLSAVRGFLAAKEKNKAATTFWKLFRGIGYLPSLKESRQLCMEIPSAGPVLTYWRMTGEGCDGRKTIDFIKIKGRSSRGVKRTEKDAGKKKAPAG